MKGNNKRTTKQSKPTTVATDSRQLSVTPGTAGTLGNRRSAQSTDDLCAEHNNRMSYTVILQEMTTGKCIGGEVETTNYRTALKTVAQAHPELSGPFYHSSHHIVQHVLSGNVPTPKLKPPKHFDGGLNVAQGGYQNPLFAVGISDLKTGNPHVVAIRCLMNASQQTYDYSVAAAAEKIGVTCYKAHRIWTHNSFEVSFQQSQYQYLVSRQLARKVNDKTIQRLRRECPVMSDALASKSVSPKEASR